MLDTKIVNATVVDGSGNPARHGSIGIHAGRIVSVGRVDDVARETIDAHGQVVSPGFVDSHTHYDAQVFWDPYLTPSCYHGVTTILGGNCGFSVAPLAPGSAEYLGPMLARVEGMPLSTLQQGVPWDWTSFGSYLQRLEGNIGLNAGFFVGHSAIRRAVMGERAVGHRASDDEIADMKGVLDASIREGALGFSTTISRSHNDAQGNPVPSRHASREEILELASVCAAHEGTGLELLPNLEFDQATIELMTEFSLAGKRPVNWNVLAVTDSTPADVAEVERKLAISDYAHSRGGKIVALAFVSPPTIRINFHAGMVFDALPDWAPLFRLSPAERLAKLTDPDYRQFLQERAATEAGGVFANLLRWDEYRICEVFAPENKPFQGRTVGEVAATLGKHPFDSMLDIVVNDGLRTVLMPPPGKEDSASYALRARVWKDERTVVGASDAGAHMDMIDTFAFSTRLLQKGVREHGVLTLEEAIHQLTEVPARMMGLRERGLIREGFHADLVIFDPETVAQGDVYMRSDLPGDEARLYADAIGVSRVIVNGVTIVSEGRHTGATPGTVLRPGRDTYTNAIPAARAPGV